MSNYSKNMYYLTDDQAKHLLALVEMRLSELVLCNENPIIIEFYRSIKQGLGVRS